MAKIGPEIEPKVEPKTEHKSAPMPLPRTVTLLGATGSIGSSTVDLLRREPGRYDREVLLVLKEFEPTFSRGGDMPQDFLPPIEVKELKNQVESAMKASLAKGAPHGYEVGYRSFTINGRMLGHGEPIRVKPRDRVEQSAHDVFRILCPEPHGATAGPEGARGRAASTTAATGPRRSPGASPGSAGSVRPGVAGTS